MNVKPQEGDIWRCSRRDRPTYWTEYIVKNLVFVFLCNDRGTTLSGWNGSRVSGYDRYPDLFTWHKVA